MYCCFLASSIHMARMHKHDTAGNFSNSIWKQRQCAQWPTAVLQLLVNPQMLAQWYLEKRRPERAVGGITQMARVSLTDTLWTWSAARKIYVLSLKYNSGLHRVLMSHFSIHAEFWTLHIMGAVSSVSDQCGAVTRRLWSDCKHIALAAFPGHSPGEQRN